MLLHTAPAITVYFACVCLTVPADAAAIPNTERTVHWSGALSLPERCCCDIAVPVLCSVCWRLPTPDRHDADGRSINRCSHICHGICAGPVCPPDDRSDAELAFRQRRRHRPADVASGRRQPNWGEPKLVLKL